MKIIDRIDLPYGRLLGRLLIKELDPHTITEGGIHIPDTAQEDRLVAKVLKIGPDVGWALFGKDARDVREEAPESIPKVGDLVSVGRYVLRSTSLGGLEDTRSTEEELSKTHVIGASDVLVIVKKEKSSG